MDNLLDRLEKNLTLLGKHQSSLKEVNIGLERETLRINQKTGRISDKGHPEAIGSALTHSNITTDFSESLLEFVTDPVDSPEAALTDLNHIQRFILEKLDEELFWPNSMPPYIESEDEIKIGYYGTSNDGKMKSLYRKGLSLRYGKMMQVISGIHYNFSLKDHLLDAFQVALAAQSPAHASVEAMSLQQFKTDRYLHACRNISRYGFVIPFLLGASPVMDKSFLRGKENPFASLNASDSYLEKGESLRLSDIGYGNNKCHFDVSFNTIEAFTKNIQFAITTPCNIFSQIPVVENGEYNQINNHILQIENEYYASVRPKQIMRAGENFLTALNRRGIEYIELRSIDINPLVAEGIGIEEMRFIQLLMTASILTDAPELSQKEYEHNQKNMKAVAKRGLDLDQAFTVAESTMTLKESILAVLRWLTPLAPILGEKYQAALETMYARVEDPSLLPSQQVLSMLKESGTSYQAFFLAQAKRLYQEEFAPLAEEKRVAFEVSAVKSVEKQRAIEAEPQIPFAQYLDNYFQFES